MTPRKMAFALFLSGLMWMALVWSAVKIHLLWMGL